MRNDRKRWLFLKSEIRPVLTPEQVIYHRRALTQTLKSGIEIELNMPSKSSGQCRGENQICSCKYEAVDNCWKTCINKEECLSLRTKDLCYNMGDEACEKIGSDCSICDRYVFRCIGITCSNFISACFTCSLYEKECASCKYKFDETKNPNYLRNNMIKALSPTKNYGNVGSTGVHSITTDGSLLGDGGVEIITNGRRVSYWEFYKRIR